MLTPRPPKRRKVRTDARRLNGVLLALLAVGVAVGIAFVAFSPSSPCWWSTSDAGRDICRKDRMEDASVSASEAYVLAAGIKDSVVRGAAVNDWLRSHRNVTVADATRVCSLLSQKDAPWCVRRASAQHLQ